MRASKHPMTSGLCRVLRHVRSPEILSRRRAEHDRLVPQEAHDRRARGHEHGVLLRVGRELDDAQDAHALHALERDPGGPLEHLLVVEKALLVFRQVLHHEALHVLLVLVRLNPEVAADDEPALVAVVDGVEVAHLELEGVSFADLQRDRDGPAVLVPESHVLVLVDGPDLEVAPLSRIGCSSHLDALRGFLAALAGPPAAGVKGA
mmetsp:Transcript_73363/g.215157  ORF Transcript_73363/g.215157 Transcript_73363/m.215157 type:complete len:206 (-) Transcript_73363:488-1105(-)